MQVNQPESDLPLTKASRSPAYSEMPSAYRTGGSFPSMGETTRSRINQYSEYIRPVLGYFWNQFGDSVKDAFKDRLSGGSGGGGSKKPPAGRPYKPNYEGDDDMPNKRKPRRRRKGPNGDTDSGSNGSPTSTNPSSGGGGSSTTRYVPVNALNTKTLNSPSAGYDDTSGTSLSYSSGVESGVYKLRRSQTSNVYSPLYIATGNWLEIQTVTGMAVNYLQEYYKDFILPATQRIIQNSQNPRGQQLLSNFEVTGYFDTLIGALQLYCQYASVIAFSNNKDNVNRGVEFLRDNMSNEAIHQHKLLGEALQRYVLPPEVVKFVNYAMQNFTMTQDPTSPIFRYSYSNIINPSNLDDWKLGNSLKSFRQLLNDTASGPSDPKAMTIRNDIMTRAFPDWRLSTLPVSSSVAIYDDEMIMHWHNQNVSYAKYNSTKVGTELLYTQELNESDTTTNLYYGLLGDTVDGVIYSASSICSVKEGADPIDPTGRQVFAGIWQPYRNWSLTGPNTDAVNVIYYKEQGTVNGLFVGIGKTPHSITCNIHKVPQTVDGTTWTILEGSRMQFSLSSMHSIDNMKYATERSVYSLFYPGNVSG